MQKSHQNLRDWFFALDQQEKRLLQVTLDALIVPTTFLLAYYMRVDNTDFLNSKDTFVCVLIAVTAVFGIYTLREYYNRFVRYVTVESIYSVGIASAGACAALYTGTVLLELQVPRSIPIVFAILLFVFSLGAQLIIHRLSLGVASKNDRENVAIYGAGSGGIHLMEALRQNSNYRVKLFIDDNPDFDGKNLAGIPVYSLEHAGKKFEKLEIETLLLAAPAHANAIRKIVYDLLPDHPFKVKTVPSISDLMSGGSDIADLKDLKVEDLLGREPVRYENPVIAENITGKKVLVTGAGGSIGSELCRQIISLKPSQLILLDISEFSIYSLMEELKHYTAIDSIEVNTLIGSVQDRNFIKKVFERFPVDTTFHAAAYKHVPLMEENVMQCIANNVFGTLNMVELAIAAKVKNFTFISTDKAVRPTNFMGASKRIAEIICQTLPTSQTKTRFTTVRFGNVLGSSGSVVPLFKKQIEEGGPITLTHPDITRYFMTIPEAAQLVIQAGSMAEGGEVFVLDMGNPVKIIDLARNMATLSGLTPVWDSTEPLKVNEIEIAITGLRPGEKLFEELSYDEDLRETAHPRIKKTLETPMSVDALRDLLMALETAIFDGDHQSLYKIIKSVTDAVAGINSSRDNFIERDIRKPAAVVPIKNFEKG